MAGSDPAASLIGQRAASFRELEFVGQRSFSLNLFFC